MATGTGAESAAPAHSISEHLPGPDLSVQINLDLSQQVKPLQLLGLTPGQGAEVLLPPQRPPATKNSAQDAARWHHWITTQVFMLYWAVSQASQFFQVSKEVHVKLTRRHPT